MTGSVRRSETRQEPETGDKVGVWAWASDRAAVLLAIGTLFALVAILIVISLLHPR